MSWRNATGVDYVDNDFLEVSNHLAMNVSVWKERQVY